MTDGGAAAEPFRALLDPCSEATLVSLELARKLGCRLRHMNIGITGVVGSVMDSARYQTSLYLVVAALTRLVKVEAFVLRTVGIVTPAGPPRSKLAEIRRDLPLADPDFDKPGKVDAVLGADVYQRIMRSGFRRYGSVLAQDTVFGWTLTGRVPATVTDAPSRTHACATLSDPEVEPCHEKLLDLMQRFWSLEEVPQVKRVSALDLECERIYTERCHRDPDGRYVVPLPLKLERVALLGESLTRARSALTSVHRRMLEDRELSECYRQFMEEYSRLGHMRLLTADEIGRHRGPVHYIPHHGIWQRRDGGDKLRVVFNASRPTSSGHSLNDALHTGPKLQLEIATVITRWRRHRFAFCADVQMMFRQIRIDERDIHLQRILWSPSIADPPQHYALLTVTYGEACAPYLALRTMRQLCSDEGSHFPLARETVEQDLYMDDFLSGSHDLESTRLLRSQLTGLLTAGGFHLRKWVANDPEILADIPVDDRLRPSWVHLSTDGPVNELGVVWDPVADLFGFRSPTISTNTQVTKRKALSELASIFDPAGWLTPATLIAKLIVQDLWRARLDWDETIPKSLNDRWIAFRASLQGAAEISMPRWVGYTPTCGVQLHAFADASRRALAAVVYLRATSGEARARITLIGAKSKLASIKSLQPQAGARARMTIPRLELRATLIAARLLTTAAAALRVPPSSCHLWSDSRVALCWLRSDGPVGNDLVDNYISHIQELSAGVTLHHVPTASNPADVASRGTELTQLARHPLWWTGPTWLAGPESGWPPEEPPSTTAAAKEPITSCLTSLVNQGRATRTHLERFSALGSLVRGTARAGRLLRRRSFVGARVSLQEPIPAVELRQAFLICVRLSQRQHFSTEIEQLDRERPLRVQSALKSLAPFLDDDGILRVGGRLGNSSLPYDERHPVVLDGRSHLALLILRWAHERSLHGGFRATYARVIQKAWVTGGKVRVKRHLRQCLVCARIAARTSAQGMAPLPPARVTPSRPFTKCGVDYAGPFSLCRSRGRGVPTYKGYVALFVCMSTKAVHLEAVGDLTTKSFLGALERFTNRKGLPAEIWSDNGTNFKGASLQLQRLLREAELDWGAVEGSLAQEGVTWKFIPPAAPHFGGLWEAGVKSMKVHLQRVASPRRLTYEEFSTLLTSVEAILNSRPLAPPAGDLGDLEALTPSHFLIGTSATSYPQPARPEANLDRECHWELVKAMRDRFWDRWSREYLNTLIQRPKWRKPQPNLEVNDLVVVVDPSLLRSDGRWPLGRVTATHPGRDGLVRTATVKTASGEYLRPVVKLARLPLHTDDPRKPE